MANTHHQIFIHSIFAVKHRGSLIQQQWKADLFAVIGNLINETGCKIIIANGTEDHVHCLISMKPDISVSEVMKNVKAKSSKWINESRFLDSRFEWQSGFGTFSYSKSQVPDVIRYIQNQEEHHKKMTFVEEYIQFLKKFEIEYDKRYIFKMPE
ncbi:IS200/IS605 family transposase [Antarcticibacterium flavum]|uniref:IS200/IS605 family transposase n=1 Tax=Antarcticibacterium flavum TaxID=2058175 RepID=A0A5B7X2U3_9FLAO|nr:MULTISPECIES: IS200/IS605 family transposase [Antarcticibacterium]MCM4161610.1 IS200/IS605 family transposase [Antarcticibacterium sp. W02-3]QCY69022.1 IS200/IS605 family transposase [Antarcticibacterium flavum]